MWLGTLALRGTSRGAAKQWDRRTGTLRSIAPCASNNNRPASVLCLISPISNHPAMNSTRPVFDMTSSSTRNQHPNVKEEVEADSLEQVIKVEDDEKPIVCQCDQCSSGCRKRMARCPRTMTWSSSQVIKKEELEVDEQHDEQQSGEMAVKEEEDSSRNRVVKEEVKEEEDQPNMACPLNQCGLALVKSEIVKMEDEEETCPCEDCGMVKTEGGDEEIKAEEEGANEMLPSNAVAEEMTVEGGGSSDCETVIEDGSEAEENWLPSTAGNLASSSEETEDGLTELMQEPNADPLEVRPVASADTAQTGPLTSRNQKRSQSNRRRQSSRSGHASHRSVSSVNDTEEVFDSTSPPAEQVQTANGCKRRRCPQCQKNVTHLVQHLRTHTGERPHICDQCGRSFSQKSHLNTHMRQHTGEKPFSCQHCGRSFSHRYSLTFHLERHSGLKPHQCDQCPSAFFTKHQLTSHHRQKHSGERPFACHIANCQKAFARSSSLKAHLKYHSGEKNYHCEDCEMRFVTSNGLTTHRRRVHSTERPYRCQHAGCNYASADKSNFNRHLNLKHHQ